MEVLCADEIGHYCGADPEARQNWLVQRAQRYAERPLYLLPVFQLCQALYFVARDARWPRERFDRFRRCWSALLDAHDNLSSDGAAICLDYDDGERDDELLKHLRTIVPSQPTRAPLARGQDARERRDDYSTLCERFAQLHQRRKDQLARRGEDALRWGAPSLAAMPLPCLLARPGEDLVVDSNNLMELLNVWPDRLDELRGKVAPGALQAFRRALRQGGLGGKLIVPASVLEETERNVRRKPPYAAALKALQEMAVRGVPVPLVIDPLTLEVFNCLLSLLQRLVQEQEEVRSWPTFADALVIAHALYHGRPIASNEWIHKDDWSPIERLYGFLVLR